MKKWLVIGVIMLVVALGASYVFAAAPETPAAGKGSFNVEQMIDACKQVVNNLVKDGTLSPDQGKEMNDRMNTMAPMIKDRMENNTNMTGPGIMGQAASQGMPCYDNGKTQ
jgi:hypothetical protein